MEELRPQDIEDLLQELGEEEGGQESLPREVEELLHVLRFGDLYPARRDAAKRLGKVRTSSPRIVRGLIAAYESDPYAEVNRAAAKALRAPVHQEYLQEHPDLMEATERALQPPTRKHRVLPQQPSRKHTAGDDYWRDLRDSFGAVLRGWRDSLEERLIGRLIIGGFSDEPSMPSDPDALLSSLQWTFWLDFVGASLLGGLTLSALGGFVAGFLPVPGLAGAIGGAVGGIVAARIHWLGLRRHISLTPRWVLICCVVGAGTWAIATAWSMAEAHGLSFPVIARKVEVWVTAGILAGAVGGAVSGMMQTRILRQQISRVAKWWLLPNTLGWAAGGAIFLPTFWAWGIGLIGGGNPGASAEWAIRRNAAVCQPVFGPLFVIVLIWVLVQAIRRR